MTVSQMAQALGRLGGLARGARLSPAARRRIAATGGRAKRDSVLATRRIVDNLRYAEAASALEGAPRIVRRATAPGPLPRPG
jgi:hypothetical protein